MIYDKYVDKFHLFTGNIFLNELLLYFHQIMWEISTMGTSIIIPSTLQTENHRELQFFSLCYIFFCSFYVDLMIDEDFASERGEGVKNTSPLSSNSSRSTLSN